MTSFFPDLNVWMVLSVEAHSHSSAAWEWLGRVGLSANLIISRYTQLGLLRLLTNQSVMGEQTLTLGEAWSVYDRWRADRRVAFYPEPRDLDVAFRRATAPLSSRPAWKWIGDCFLLALSNEIGSQLVTFDRALAEFAREHGYSVVIPG